MIATVAGAINNIGACIAIGAFAGLFSGFWLRVVHPKLNATRSLDHLGILGPVLICSIIGGLVVSPAMYKIYKNMNTMSSGLGNTVIDTNIIYYQLVYIGIAAGTAIISGLIAGSISLPIRDSTNDY